MPSFPHSSRRRSACDAAQAAGEADLAECGEPSRSGRHGPPTRSRARRRGRRPAPRCERRPRRSRTRPRSRARPRMPAEHGDDHREPLGSTPVPTRRGIARSVGATSAWTSSRSGRVPSSAQPTAAPISPGCVAPKSSDGSGTPTRPGGRHLEDAELVRRAEPVLRRAQDAVLVVAVALELEDAVDEVLETRGPATAPSFVTWPTRTVATPASFATRSRQPRRLAHLGDRAGRRPEGRGVQRLHGVDDADVRAARLERRADRVELRLGEDLDRLGAAEPAARSATWAVDSSP